MPRFLLLCLVGLMLTLPASADNKDNKNEARIKAELARSFPELKSATVRPSPVPGIYEIEFDSKIIYSTDDAKFLFVGDLLELSTKRNLSEAKRAALRMRMLDEVGEQNMLVIGPAKATHTLTVFTDVDCGYCARFHLDVPTLNKQGVKVRYLFYPRSGINTESYRKAVAVWCADDRAKAIGLAKAGSKIDMKTCANPVESHYRLGQALEIGGTPAIFLDNGKVLPGYIPAPRLLGLLGING